MRVALPGEVLLVKEWFYYQDFSTSILDGQYFCLNPFFVHFIFFLLWHLLKNLKTNKIINLSIFTPIFILYPLAEIEVLARKEIIVFTFFLIYLIIPSHHKLKNFSIVFFFLFFSFSLGANNLFFPSHIFIFNYWEQNCEV